MGSFTHSLALLLALQLPSGTPQTVSGRVVRPGDHRMDPIAGMTVTLHRVGSDAQGPLDSTRTDSRGRFSFHYKKTGTEDAIYFVSGLYRGIAYFTYFTPEVGNFRMAPIDQFGHETQTWQWMRNVNLQVGKLAPTLLKLKSDRAYHLGRL